MEPKEVRTRSIPLAAHLLILGFKIERVIHRPHGGSLLCFPLAARDAVTTFYNTKTEVDGILFEQDGLR